MSAQVRSRCPVCDADEVKGFLEIPRVPVYCNVLWPSREEALAAPRGDLDLAYCGGCGHVFNRRFDPGLVEYTGDYENSLHYSPRFQEYADKLAADLIARHDLHDLPGGLLSAGQFRGAGHPGSFRRAIPLYRGYAGSAGPDRCGGRRGGGTRHRRRIRPRVARGVWHLPGAVTSATPGDGGRRSHRGRLGRRIQGRFLPERPGRRSGDLLCGGYQSAQAGQVRPGYWPAGGRTGGFAGRPTRRHCRHESPLPRRDRPDGGRGRCHGRHPGCRGMSHR